MRLLFLISLMTAALPSLGQQDTIFKHIAAAQTENGVLLSFTIAGGLTCTGVKVERSGDNTAFVEIHEFLGVCGNPVSDESYNFLDRNPDNNSRNFYRLELGSWGIYSDVIPVQVLNVDKVVVSPQPASGPFEIRFTNFSRTPHRLDLYDIHGQSILTKTDIGQVFSIDQQLVPGMYLFTIQRNSEPRFSGKVLVL